MRSPSLYKLLMSTPLVRLPPLSPTGANEDFTLEGASTQGPVTRSRTPGSRCRSVPPSTVVSTSKIS